MKIHKASRYRGAGTTTQRDDLTNPQAGWQWYNTDRSKTDTFDGVFWLGPGDYVLNNGVGASPDIGKALIIDSAADFQAKYATKYYDENVQGVVSAGNTNKIVMSRLGVHQLLVESNDIITAGDWLLPITGGLFIGEAVRDGVFAKALETKTSGSNFLIWAMIGSRTEAY